MNQEKSVLTGVVYFKVGTVLTALEFKSRGESGLFRAALRLDSPTVFLITFLERKGTAPKQGLPPSPCATPHKKKLTLVFHLRKNPSSPQGVVAGPSVGESIQDREPCWILDALAHKEAYLNN